MKDKINMKLIISVVVVISIALSLFLNLKNNSNDNLFKVERKATSISSTTGTNEDISDFFNNPEMQEGYAIHSFVSNEMKMIFTLLNKFYVLIIAIILPLSVLSIGFNCVKLIISAGEPEIRLKAISDIKRSIFLMIQVFVICFLLRFTINFL